MALRTQRCGALCSGPSPRWCVERRVAVRHLHRGVGTDRPTLMSVPALAASPSPLSPAPFPAVNLSREPHGGYRRGRTRRLPPSPCGQPSLALDSSQTFLTGVCEIFLLTPRGASGMVWTRRTLARGLRACGGIASPPLRWLALTRRRCWEGSASPGRGSSEHRQRRWCLPQGCREVPQRRSLRRSSPFEPEWVRSLSHAGAET